MPNLVFFLSDGVMELLCMRYLLQVRKRINLRCSSLTKRTLLCKEAGRSHLTGMYHNSEHPNHREYQKQVQLIKRTVKFFLTLAFPRQILLLITEFPLFCIEFFYRRSSLSKGGRKSSLIVASGRLQNAQAIAFRYKTVS